MTPLQLRLLSRILLSALCLVPLLVFGAVQSGMAQRETTQREAAPAATTAPADRTVRPLTVVCDGRTFTVPAFTHGGALYMSLGAFARRCGFPVVTGGTVEKLEVRIGTRRLKFTGNNPFVVLLDHGANTVDDVVQLSSEVIRVDGAYYVPLASTLPLIARAWPRSCDLDASVPELRITNDGGARVDIRGMFTGDRDLSPSDSNGEASGEVAQQTSPVQMPVVQGTGSPVRAADPGALASKSAPAASSSVAATVTRAAASSATKQAPAGGVSPGATSQPVAEQSANHKSAAASTEPPAAADAVSSAGGTEGGEQETKSGKRQKWGLDCIVIDAGHGGYEPGAIGVSGLREKNITLALALKLGRLIESRMKGVHVVYTRKDDTFVEVDRRGAIGNAKGGKLFISIHCNSMEKKPSTAHGFEVYILRPGRTDEAIRIAEFENSVVKLEKDYEKRYKKLTAEQFIMVNMAQSAYVKYSERFAELLDQSVRTSDRISSKGVKQAGFYVLVGASMPSVLIETGFISNTREEQFLASDEGQQHMADLFFRAIETYAREYEQSLRK
jgi:N-acetylmuramoyl-L-alanine amidase